jgi:hypothetical protein
MDAGNGSENTTNDNDNHSRGRDANRNYVLEARFFFQ